MKKLLTTLLCAWSIIFVIWFAVSYIDIIADNMSANPQHFDWNFFLVFFK